MFVRALVRFGHNRCVSGVLKHSLKKREIRHTIARHALAARLSLFAAMILVAPQARGQGPDVSVDEIVTRLHSKVSVFFEDVAGGQLTEAEAYAKLLQDSPLSKPNRKKKIDAIVRRTKLLESRFGTYRGFERIAAKPVGKDVIVMKYLYKCQDFPVVWYFTFYRDLGAEAAADGGRWFVVAIRFDADVELLGL